MPTPDVPLTTPRVILHLVDRVTGGVPVAVRGYIENSPPGFRHIVGTFDGSNLQIYVDGTKRGTSPSAFVLPALDSGTFVGARQKYADVVDGRLGGRIDEVAIYNFPLTEERVKAHFGARR